MRSGRADPAHAELADTEADLLCLDGMNPIAGIRDGFTAAWSSAERGCYEDFGRQFAAPVIGTALTVAPFAKGAPISSGGLAARFSGDEGSINFFSGDRWSANAADGPRLELQLAGQQIAHGHAFEKHVVTQGEYPYIRTRQQFADLVTEAMANGESKPLGDGRTAYWHEGTIIFRNPGDPDGGTAFRPSDGYDYFLRQN